MTSIAPALLAEVEDLIESLTFEEATIIETHPLSGGSINAVYRLILADWRQYVLKVARDDRPGMFAAEKLGLEALAQAQVVRVPQVMGLFAGKPSALLMEFVETGPPSPSFMEEFGRQLARLHRSTQGHRFGFHRDNFIGSTPQPNPWTPSWIAFWQEHRLGHQLALAREQGVASRELLADGERLCQSLGDLLEEPEEGGCLLHGDLWGGNYLVDDRHLPVLIDPATYYGHREAELAMTMLFGGFSRAFYQGYEDVWPLDSGSEVRLEVYKLYHLLNHLNLFGGGYLGSCQESLRKLTRLL